MSREIEKGSMREVIASIYNILRNDETLLRLLTYYPESHNNPHPLDEANENIVGSKKYWDVVEDKIMLAEKFSDIVEKDLCRLYITQGRRRPVFGNYLLATQEIIISVYVHENYETDMRSAWISDRINELIVLELFDDKRGNLKGGFGKLEYAAGNPRVAPTHYKRYDNVYELNTGKK